MQTINKAALAYRFEFQSFLSPSSFQVTQVVDKNVHVFESSVKMDSNKKKILKSFLSLFRHAIYSRSLNWTANQSDLATLADF